MRKIVLVLLLLAVSASAQVPDQPTRVSLFLTNPGFTGSGAPFDAGIGLALERRFSPHWSVQLEAAREQHEYQPSIFRPDLIEFQTYPIDAFVRYSFVSTHVRWRPYIGVGARYVSAPDEPRGANYDTQLSPQIAGGVEWAGGESWSLMADAKVLTRTDVPHSDELLKVSVGVGWRF
jgi:outer membrane protein W